MRNQGPRGDLVVEAGAYRFASNETCIHFGNTSFCIYTPITKHLVMDALKLPTKAYDPLPTAFDHVLHKIVDANGHDAGYLTFVEAMVQQHRPPNLSVHFGHRLVSVGAAAGGASKGAAADLTLQFANGESVAVSHLVLNLPQRPLLRLLDASPELLPPSATWPAPLTRANAYPIVKVYVHYDDAWWINDLNLRAGMFNNSEAWHAPGTSLFAKEDCLGARQTPYPIQGAYHDADVRCDGAGARPCRGFLQAAYMGDPQAVRLYEEFHLDGNDSAIHLDPKARASHRFVLDGLHTALVDLHRDALDAVGATARVEAMRPSGGVISAWSMRADGIETGCHMPRSASRAGDTPPSQIPAQSLAPLVGSPYEARVLVANEAYGTLECWAEGSLTMAENAVARLGVGRPDWLPESIYKKILFGHPAAVAEAERQAAAGVVYVSDLAMMEVAAKAAAAAER